MTDKDAILDALNNYRDAKRELKSHKEVLVRLVVDKLGVEQADALKLNVEDFFDGYLTGYGSTPPFRK